MCFHRTEVRCSVSVLGLSLGDKNFVYTAWMRALDGSARIHTPSSVLRISTSFGNHKVHCHGILINLSL
jgi:hypothetical protein